MSLKLQGANAMSLHVTNMDQARKWYANTLGLDEMAFIEQAGLALYAVPNGTPLALHDWAICNELGGRPPGTVTGIIFTHEDPAAFAKQVEENGGSITQPLADSPTGGKFVAVADPDGNEFLVSTP